MSNYDYSAYPYKNFSEIRIRSSEPMSSAYFNSHIIRLAADVENLSCAHTVQKASYTQWGTVKFATVNDILGEDGNRQSVLTNDVLNRAITQLRETNEREYITRGVLNFTKNYEFRHGEFIVGSGERIAKRITDYPERVVFSKVDFTPLGFDDSVFFTARTDATGQDTFKSNVKSTGVINFVDWNRPKEYTEFHVYYHNESGYVICENGKYNDNQTQIKVIWNILVRKY